MKTILLMRHAKSDWNNPLVKDHERILNEKGMQDASFIGEFLKNNGLTPEMILSSTAKRAHDTAKLVIEKSGFNGILDLKKDLYETSAYEILELISKVHDDVNSVMIIGHNPTLEDLLRHLTNEYERMGTAYVAHIQSDIDSWKKIKTKNISGLVNIYKPKE